MKNRSYKLDVLKILACFSVVVLHVTGIIANDINNSYTINHLLYYSAVLAVPMFFIVNGYLLLNKNSLEYRYVLKKIVNILIVVFCWNLLLFILKFVANKEIVNPIKESIKSLVQKGYFWQFWFFGALILIYLVLPIIHKYFKNSKTAIIITLLSIVISLIVDMLSLYRSFNGRSIVQIHVIQTFRIWTWFSYYLLGGLLGKKEIRDYILNKISKKINITIVIISFLIINFYQYFIGRILYDNTFAEYFYDNIFAFIYVASIFLLVYRINVNKNMLIDLCSKNIMGIYIIHVTILKVYTHFYAFNTTITNILLIFIIFISSLIVSELISKIPILNKLIKL